MPKRKQTIPRTRVGQGDVKLTRREFARRLSERFHDPAFRDVQAEIDRVIDVAWKAYDEYRKSPVKRRAGRGFKDPDYELSVDWLEARREILAAPAPRRVVFC